MLKKSELAVLREEIKSAASEGRATNALIREARGDERRALRDRKGSIGQDARVLLLAYALLRGVPYTSLERTTRDTAWQAGWLANGVARTAARTVPGTDREAVENWMKGAQEVAA